MHIGDMATEALARNGSPSAAMLVESAAPAAATPPTEWTQALYEEQKRIWNEALERQRETIEALAGALREYLDADAAFGAMLQEPSFAWRQAEARLRHAKIEAGAALSKLECRAP